jgi:hypothetical protein
MKKQYTFEVQREDGGFRKALIRHAFDSDKEDSRFETVAEIKEIFKTYLSMEIFVCQTILNEASVEQAKEVLKKAGYCIETLWSTGDVQSRFECSDDDAQHVVNEVLGSERICQEVNEAIDQTAEGEGLKEIYQGLFRIEGYFKDDKSLIDGSLIYEYDNCPEDMDDDTIFYYGLSEYSIKEAIKEGENTGLEFVITSYERVIK